MKYENLQPGYYYHIFNQGNNKENIFFEEKNYPYFLSLLVKYIFPISEIFAYCLLPNHFHLLIRINDDTANKQCAQSFSNFFNAYAKAINKIYQRSGSLFKRKFSRIKIENEEYLKNLVLYIHTNAQHHGIIDNFKKYSHSSYPAYVSKGPTNISKHYIIDLFDDLENFKEVHNLKSNSQFEKIEEYLLE